MATTGNRTLSMICILAATVIGTGFLYFVNPDCCPPCPLHALTGLHCPGCGATRAGHELLHGHLLAALHLNAPLVLAALVILTVGLCQALSLNSVKRLKLFTVSHLGWLILLLALTFGILRNINYYPFTLLAP
jgi:Protein of unknown function (DUF2752)